MLPIWKEAPFLRLLPPLISGILLQWYLQFDLSFILGHCAAAILVVLMLHAAAPTLRFRLRILNGAAVNLLLVTAGALVTFCNHPANGSGWLPAHYPGSGNVTAVLQEPPTPKNRSFKTLAAVKQLNINNTIAHTSGNILIYFSQKVNVSELSYGSTIIIKKLLIPVKSSGNPGAFNYERYCTFSGIAYQVYLEPHDFAVVSRSETRGLKNFIFRCRAAVINILTTYIKGPQERALAEALLIGYKNELDKDLVQAYANTGVVHIIAVSGMHLGIVYWMLSLLVQSLKTKASTRWPRLVIILAGLWLFSLMAGAGPSVVRSALMFSFIVIGETFSRRNTVYNNLAASAFLLLCWNPFWLWDVGFQLSYAAVLSIVVFFRPVYNLLYVQNKLLDAIWKLNAVTLSAQVLTLPLCLYHFHQFPNLFLLANMIAVPLSSLLLIGEIVLCILSVVPLLASWAGAALSFLINVLNRFIQHIDALPFASWSHLQLNIPQVLLLFAFIAAITVWLMERRKHAFIAALSTLLLFMILRSHSLIIACAQRKLIVYNVPKKTAIDIMEGRSYYFAGDASIDDDPFLRNFHLEPARTLYRASPSASLPGLLKHGPLYSFHGRKMLIAGNTPLKLPTSLEIDVLILSHNLSFPLQALLEKVRPAYVVADGSNSHRKVDQWRRQCRNLGISFHSVAQNGAFLMDMEE